jgi:hypothetical protein
MDKLNACTTHSLLVSTHTSANEPITFLSCITEVAHTRVLGPTGDPSPRIVSVETQSDYNRSIAAYDTELTIEVYGNPRVTEVVLLFGQRNRFTGIGVDIFESSFFYLEPRPFQVSWRPQACVYTSCTSHFLIAGCAAE